jgi:NitT/TauT family transport system substrate-binding protein
MLGEKVLRAIGLADPGPAARQEGQVSVPASRFPLLLRRNILGTAAVLAPFAAGAAISLPEVRLGVLAFGTVQWVASVMRSRGLDRAHGFTLSIQALANNDGAKVALLGGAVDIIVSDWLFVGAERAQGLGLRFAPFSSATGAIVLGRGSDVRSLKDLAHRRLGVAGGPDDKSWLIVRAAAQRLDGIDLARAANIVYAAPPLLSAKLAQGGLDAVLTYWNFAAALEVEGFHPLVAVSACAQALGLPAHPPLLGYVFKDVWAERNGSLIGSFLAASAASEDLLLRSDSAWDGIRPLMHAPNERLFVALKRGFRAGIVHESPAAAAAAADRLFAILHGLGGTAATGGLRALPDGVFWTAPS